MKNILFYGDSNTWGFDPDSRLRYPYDRRWTTVCAGLLGESCHCVAAGMNGRTTAFDDPLKGARNGIKGLDYELQTHKPLDLLTVMLGTNDLKYTDAAGSASGMEELVRLALSANDRYCLSSPVFPGERRILLIAPVLLEGHVGERQDDMAQSARLSGLYGAIAEKYGLYFLDAARYAAPSRTDGVHLAAEGHRQLGLAVAEKIREILSLR